MTSRNQILVAFLAVVVALSVVGCTKNYRITQELDRYISREDGISLGDIVDGLPIDTEEDDRPTAADLAKFRDYIFDQLEDQLLNYPIFLGSGSAAKFNITGTILTYEKGSGVARFLIGMGVGNAKVTVELKVQEVATGETVFAGNFNQTVSSGWESGDEAYKRIAKDFAKLLQKRLKTLANEG